MNEDTRAGMVRWLRRCGFTLSDRHSDADVAATAWQQICEDLNMHQNGAPMFDDDGMLLDVNGNRSVFDDVDA